MGTTPTAQECKDKVSVHEPSANGMTWDPSSQNCNAEIEQTDSDNVGPIVPAASDPVFGAVKKRNTNHNPKRTQKSAWRAKCRNSIKLQNTATNTTRGSYRKRLNVPEKLAAARGGVPPT